MAVFLPCCHSYGLVPDCETLSFVATASNGCVVNIREVRGRREREGPTHSHENMIENGVKFDFDGTDTTRHLQHMTYRCIEQLLPYTYISNEGLMFLIANISISG